MVMAVDGSRRWRWLAVWDSSRGSHDRTFFLPFSPILFGRIATCEGREGETNCLEKIIQGSTLAGLGLSSRPIVLVGWG